MGLGVLIFLPPHLRILIHWNHPINICDVDERYIASFCRETSGEIVSAATFVPRQLGLPVETGSHPPPHE